MKKQNLLTQGNRKGVGLAPPSPQLLRGTILQKLGETPNLSQLVKIEECSVTDDGSIISLISNIENDNLVTDLMGGPSLAFEVRETVPEGVNAQTEQSHEKEENHTAWFEIRNNSENLDETLDEPLENTIVQTDTTQLDINRKKQYPRPQKQTHPLESLTEILSNLTNLRLSNLE
ncbi:hypothetical protein JTB14_025480 [Gonioctena quinquepunctata]|nr:hypothetical protein JTB14_025480 [Gonioctena quinquepunctata]